MLPFESPSRPSLPRCAPDHPLGPLWVTGLPQNAARFRLIAGAVAITCCGLLGLAAWLQPDPRGLGTHEQLNLPPCVAVMRYGIPCPSCGMTTAFAHTVRGHWGQALVAQPFGFLLALGTLLGAVAGAWATVSGRTASINWYRVVPHRAALWLVATFVGAWIYKVLAVLLAAQ